MISIKYFRFDLMTKCWNEDPEYRPPFSDIVNILIGMISKKQVGRQLIIKIYT